MRTCSALLCAWSQKGWQARNLSVLAETGKSGVPQGMLRLPPLISAGGGSSAACMVQVQTGKRKGVPIALRLAPCSCLRTMQFCMCKFDAQVQPAGHGLPQAACMSMALFELQLCWLGWSVTVMTRLAAAPGASVPLQRKLYPSSKRSCREQRPCGPAIRQGMQRVGQTNQALLPIRPYADCPLEWSP